MTTGATGDTELVPDHSWKTCPVFGGCDDCRSAQFAKHSPDVKLGPIANYIQDTAKVWDDFWNEHPRYPRRGMKDPSTTKYDVDPRPVPFRDPKGAHNPTPAIVPLGPPAPYTISDGVAYGESATPKGAMAAFNQAVNETLERAQAVSDTRGDEYGDTWAIENQFTPFSDSVRELVARGRFVGPRRQKKLIRLGLIASLIDVKISRMIGPWKADTVEDLINYLGAFRAWRDDPEVVSMITGG